MLDISVNKEILNFTGKINTEFIPIINMTNEQKKEYGVRVFKNKDGEEEETQYYKDAVDYMTKTKLGYKQLQLQFYFKVTEESNTTKNKDIINKLKNNIYTISLYLTSNDRVAGKTSDKYEYTNGIAQTRWALSKDAVEFSDNFKKETRDGKKLKIRITKEGESDLFALIDGIYGIRGNYPVDINKLIIGDISQLQELITELEAHPTVLETQRNKRVTIFGRVKLKDSSNGTPYLIQTILNKVSSYKINNSLDYFEKANIQESYLYKSRNLELVEVSDFLGGSTTKNAVPVDDLPF